MILSAFTLFNVQLLLLSKIGQPYDPVANTGVIGRNFTHQTMSSVNGFFDNKKFNFNPFIASGSIGMCIDEFNGDNFDHGPHGFVGGGYMGQVQTNGRPIETTPVPPGTPKWGAQWKKAVRDNYLSTVKPAPASTAASTAIATSISISIRPTRDRFGRPLMRMTIDFHDNELKQTAFLTDKFAEIVKAMGAREVVEGIPQGALRHHGLPDDASERRRHHGHRSQDQRAQPLSAELGRAESVRDGRQRLSAERRLQSRPARSRALAYWAADGDPQSISEEPGAAGRCVS